VLLFDAACPMIDGRLKKRCLGWMSERQEEEELDSVNFEATHQVRLSNSEEGVIVLKLLDMPLKSLRALQT